jgi:hypothetical protein
MLYRQYRFAPNAITSRVGVRTIALRRGSSKSGRLPGAGSCCLDRGAIAHRLTTFARHLPLEAALRGHEPPPTMPYEFGVRARLRQTCWLALSPTLRQERASGAPVLEDRMLEPTVRKIGVVGDDDLQLSAEGLDHAMQ